MADKKNSLGQRPRYEARKDRTLTGKQRIIGGFRPAARLGGDFRYESNDVIDGYASGYHESAVTTDMFMFLREAKPSKGGKYTLATKASSKNSFFNKPEYLGRQVSAVVLNHILNNADGFRTDTAQTIMSADHGLVAGHAGSNINTENQSSAHNLLRKKMMDLVMLDEKKYAGLTENSIIAIMGSITISSTAPGRLARNVKGGTSHLKAGPKAKEEWEKKRNHFKRRLFEFINPLSKDEKDFIDGHAAQFMDSTQKGVADPLSRRKITNGRGASPSRVEDQEVIGEVAGGGYLLNEPNIQADDQAPLELRHMGVYFTQSHRAARALK